MVHPTSSFEFVDSQKFLSGYAHLNKLVTPNQHRFYLSPSFLNLFTEWEALVKINGSGFILLPIKSRWGFKQLWIPPFCQRLEWQGSWTSDEILNGIEAIDKQYRFIHTNLSVPLPIKLFIPRPNLILNLDAPYTELHEGYSKDLRKTLRKKTNKPFDMVQENCPEITIDLYRRMYGNMNRHLTDAAFTALVSYLKKQDSTYLQWNLVMEGGTEGSILLVRSQRRWHYILGAPTEAGRNVQAVIRLMDAAIKELADSEDFLDFEGSKISGVAKVYKSFGSEQEEFWEWKKAPKLVEWLRG